MALQVNGCCSDLRESLLQQAPANAVRIGSTNIHKEQHSAGFAGVRQHV